MAYQLKWSEKGVVATFSGSFTALESNRATIEIYKDPKSEDMSYVIWDVSGIKELLMTKSESQSLAITDKLVGSRLEKFKLAFVATDEKVRSMCGQYALYAVNYDIPWEFKAFDTFEEAKSWCNS